MSKTIHIGGVSIPLHQFVVSRTAMLGITKSGKSYGAKGIAEQLLAADIPIVVFDAIGVWRWLKTAAATDGGRGFPVVVAGGAEPDLPLTPASAPSIVRAAIKENIPLVIDLYDSRLSKSDWRRIVQESLRILLYENKGLRHIFLEEAAEFAPQKVLDGATYAEVEKLARMGGNASLGITFINQRAQELNKAVLELCDNVVLFRQRGSHAIDSLQKWLDRLAPTKARDIAESLPHMKAGECWVFSEEAEQAVRTVTRALRSFHPDRMNPTGGDGLFGGSGASVDTSDFVNRMAGDLAQLVEESKANDPQTMKARIAQLEARNSALSAHVRELEARGAKEVPILGAGFAEMKDRITSLKCDIDALLKRFDAAEERLGARATDALILAPSRQPSRVIIDEGTGLPWVPSEASHAAGRSARAPVDGVKLSKCERAILTVLAQCGDSAKRKIAIMAGYTIDGGGFNNALASLRSKGFIGASRDPITKTQAGMDALGGDFEALPRGLDAVMWWAGRLPKAENAILLCLMRADGYAMAKADLASSTNYEVTGGGFNNALSALRTRELIEGRDPIRLLIP